MKRLVHSLLILAFTASSVFSAHLSYAQIAPVSLSPVFVPAYITGLTINPKNPFQLDFIVDTGDNQLSGEALKMESMKLVKYFMASLTVPENDMWVNLSPYEKDRIIADGLGGTDMGKEMLAQDYILKQLTAVLISPENELGKKFWEKIYSQIGTTEIPVETFNPSRPPPLSGGETDEASPNLEGWAGKVWIVPDKASVYVHGNSVLVVEAKLKVMLQQDIPPPTRSEWGRLGGGQIEGDPSLNPSHKGREAQLIEEIILPAIEREVNEGANFANLRQIYNSLILATWYKNHLKQSILNKVYVNQNKIDGINLDDKNMKDKIFNQYLEAFKKGAADLIKEDYDPQTQTVIPRKYFVGGEDFAQLAQKFNNPDQASLKTYTAFHAQRNHVNMKVNLGPVSDNSDTAMMAAHSYQAAEQNERQKILDEIRQTMKTGFGNYMWRFVEFLNEVPGNSFSYHEDPRVAPFGLNDGIFQKGLLKDENGVFWIVKEIGISHQGKVKNVPKRELFAYLFAREKANLVEIRLLTEEGKKKLPFLTSPASEYFLTRVATSSNMRAVQSPQILPHQNFPQAYSALFVSSILLRKFDHHSANISYVENDVPVAIDHDQSLAETADDFSKFQTYFIGNLSLGPIGMLNLSSADLSDLVRNIKIISHILNRNEFQYQRALEKLDFLFHRWGIGKAVIKAQGLNPKDIQETIQQFKTMTEDEIARLLIAAGYLDAPTIAADVRLIKGNIDRLGRDVNTIWKMMTNGEDGGFDKLDPAMMQITRVTPLRVKTVGDKETLRVEVEVKDSVSGKKGFGYYTVPYGTSSGKDERKTEEDFEKLVQQVKEIDRRVKAEGLSADRLPEIGKLMLKMQNEDGVFLGAQATLGYQMALAQAVANARGEGLYKLIRDLAPALNPGPGHLTTLQQNNVTEGGVHSTNHLDMQEFMFTPVGKTIEEANRMDSELVVMLGRIYQAVGLNVNLDDEGLGPLRTLEGGYNIPDLTVEKLKSIIANREQLIKKFGDLLQNLDWEVLVQQAESPSPHEFVLYAMEAAIKNLWYIPSRSGEVGTVGFALDPAATEMAKDKNGIVKDDYFYEGRRRSAEEMISLYAKWAERFPIVSLEDGLHEDHWDAWLYLIEQLGDNVTIVGDDLLVTQGERLEKLIELMRRRDLLDENGKAKKKVAILIKLNQNGFLTTGNKNPQDGYMGTLEVMELAVKHGFALDISHRSKEAAAENNETARADLAAAVNAKFAKFGTRAQETRRIALDRLAEIDKELRSSDAAMITQAMQDPEYWAGVRFTFLEWEAAEVISEYMKHALRVGGIPMIVIDGPSGIGKSTLVKNMKKLLARHRFKSGFFGLDMFMADRQERWRIINGIYQWTLTPKDYDERNFFDTQRIINELVDPLVAFKQSGEKEKIFKFSDVYNHQNKNLGKHQATITDNTIIIIEGKYAFTPELVDRYGQDAFRIRIRKDPVVIREQYYGREKFYRSSEQMQILMDVYDRFFVPSYEKYLGRATPAGIHQMTISFNDAEADNIDYYYDRIHRANAVAGNSKAVDDDAMTGRVDQQSPVVRPPGGIDFNPNNLNLNTQGQTMNFNFPDIDPAMLPQGPVNGFAPVIIQITPIGNFLQLLGLKTPLIQ